MSLQDNGTKMNVLSNDKKKKEKKMTSSHKMALLFIVYTNLTCFPY